MMSSRERTRLDDDIDALLLSHQMHSKERIKKERRGWSVWIHPYTWEWQRGVIHHGFLLALKSRVLVASKERRRKAKTLGLLARSSKVVPFPVLLRTARCSSAIPSSVFPTFSSVSPLYIFTSAVFVSTTEKVVERLLFIHFGLGPLFGFILCRAKNFPLFPSSLSLSLSLFRLYIHTYTRRS